MVTSPSSAAGQGTTRLPITLARALATGLVRASAMVLMAAGPALTVSAASGARAQEAPVQEPASPAAGAEAGAAQEAAPAEEAAGVEAERAAPPLRVHLRWQGAASLRLEMVGPGGVPVDPRSAAVRSGHAAEGAGEAWLEWASEPPAGTYLICALGDAGAGTPVSVEVQRDGRTGTRDYTVSGRVARPCTRQSRGYLLGITVGSGPAVTPTEPAPAPEPGPANGCADGRQPVEGGYCCWPGQRFDAAASRCAGPPRCPPGFAAAGADCQRRADTTAVGVAATPSGPGFGAAASGGTHIDAGLVVAGSIVLGLGYASSVIFGILGDNFVLLIPVVGGLIHAPLNGSEGGILLGISVSAVQIAGLILLVCGAAANHPNEPAQAGLEPALVPGPGEAGLGLRWRF